mmetsp:Transcript_53026/g.126763  ORF Transcript_53026/g.126763 Transcript_53026/m.126763 type:complete len:329 (-) Transcript_53026:2254-3240(-)
MVASGSALVPAPSGCRSINVALPQTGHPALDFHEVSSLLRKAALPVAARVELLHVVDGRQDILRRRNPARDSVVELNGDGAVLLLIAPGLRGQARPIVLHAAAAHARRVGTAVALFRARKLIGASESISATGLNHLLNFSLRKPPLVVADGHLVALASGLLRRSDVQDAICVDLEGHLHLRPSLGHRRQPAEHEAPQEVVLLALCGLALVNADGDAGLVVPVGGQRHGFPRGDGRVPSDDSRHGPVGGLEADGEGRHIQQQQVQDLVLSNATENCGLDCVSADHGLFCSDPCARLLVKEVPHQLAELGGVGSSPHQQDIMNVGLVQLT